MKKIIILLLLLSSILNSKGQQITQEWVKTFGENNSSISYPLDEMKTDKFGNTYVFLTRDSLNHLKGILIKYNSQGIVQWMNTYDSLFPLGKMTLDKEGNIYISSKIYNNLIAGYDVITIKYDNSGNFKWRSYLYGNSNLSYTLYAIVCDDSLNVYISGRFANQNTLGFLTVKYDSLGNLKFAAETPNNYNAPDGGTRAIVIDSSHNIYVTGMLDSVWKGSCLTIKYDINGNQLWAKLYNDSLANNTYGTSIAISNDGFIYVGVISGSGSNNNIVCIKYDSLGNKIWSKLYNQVDTIEQNGYVFLASMKLDSYGNIYLLSVCNNFLTLKLNSNGELLWRKSYNESQPNTEFGSNYLAIDEMENVYVTGAPYDSAVSTYIVTTIKYDSSGNMMWIGKYNNGSYSILGLDSLNNVYVSSSSYPDISINTMKYDFNTGVETIKGNNNSVIVYPNPANNTLNIHFAPNSQLSILNSQLIITNVLGEEVYHQAIINQQSSTINISNLSTGVYFYSISNLTSSLTGSLTNIRGKFVVER